MPKPTHTTIAPNLSSAVARLQSLLTDLKKADGNGTNVAIDDLISRLCGWNARIAIVGERQSGKSSLINSLLGRTDLLPTQTHPNSVASLRVCINSFNDRLDGCKFRFFNQDDWDTMINAVTDSRKFASDIFYGIDHNIVAKEAEHLKQIAMMELNEEFVTLLGREINYKEFKRDLVDRYLSETEAEDSGKYSAIVKDAEFYVASQEFNIPVTLTDCPAFNDDALLRNEICLDALHQQDIILLVTSVHHSFSDADLHFLEFISQNTKSEIVIFVNRFDELEFLEADAEIASKQLFHRLRNAVPGVEPTIIMGSAHYAKQALEGENPMIANPDAVKSYLSSIGKTPSSSLQGQLLQASGIPDLKRILSAVLDHGIEYPELTTIGQDALFQSNSAVSMLENQKKLIQIQINSALDDNKTTTVDLKSAEAETETQDIVLGHTQDMINVCMDQLESSVAAIVDLTTKRIGLAKSRFQSEQIDWIISQMSDDPKNEDNVFEIQTDELVEKIHSEFHQMFNRYSLIFDMMRDNCVQTCIMTLKLDTSVPTDHAAMIHFEDWFISNNTLKAKRHKLKLPRKPRWFGSTEQTVKKQVQAILNTDVTPAETELMEAFKSIQSQHAKSGFKTLKTIVDSVQSENKKRAQHLADLKEQLLTKNSTIRRTMIPKNKQEIVKLEAKLKTLQAINSDVSRLVSNW